MSRGFAYVRCGKCDGLGRLLAARGYYSMCGFGNRPSEGIVLKSAKRFPFLLGACRALASV